MIDLIESAKSLAAIGNKVADVTELAVSENSIGLIDWAQITITVASPLIAPLTDPGVKPLAKLAAARYLCSVTFDKMQKWYEAYDHELTAANPNARAIFDGAFNRVFDARSKIYALEIRWFSLPSTWISRAANTFYSGLLKTVQEWGDALANPLGIPWKLIIGGVIVTIVIVAVVAISGKVKAVTS